MSFIDLPSIPAAPDEIEALLNDHHVVVLGAPNDQWREFARVLSEHLTGLPDTGVIVIRSGDLAPLAGIRRSLTGAGVERDRIQENLESLTAVLREGVTGARHEYFLWEDAEDALEADVQGFGQIVNALLSVAAEREFISPEVLQLQRVVFFGGAKLGAYAEEAAGQFRSWLTGDERLEAVAKVVERPPVIAYRLDG